MKVILVAAMAKNRVIGRNNELPWHLPADLRHFKAVTARMPVLMGRKTHDSIGRPLPRRRNIIISRQIDLQAPGCEVVHSLVEALKLVKNEPTVAIIGGQSIYKQALPFATHMELTYIDADIQGDTFFPEWSHLPWYETAREVQAADIENEYAYEFLSLQRA